MHLPKKLCHMERSQLLVKSKRILGRFFGANILDQQAERDWKVEEKTSSIVFTGKILIVDRENGGTLGMVPLIINAIHTLYSMYLLGISP